MVEWCNKFQQGRESIKHLIQVKLAFVIDPIKMRNSCKLHYCANKRVNVSDLNHMLSINVETVHSIPRSLNYQQVAAQ